MHDGGYDAGYAACPCFWGTTPSSLVRQLFDEGRDLNGLRVLDAGCGEGKNAFALAERGCEVDAIDCSDRAVGSGRRQFPHPAIIWRVADLTTWKAPAGAYDIVLAYGLLHCLPTVGAVKRLVENLQDATRPGGLNVVCAFNDGPHDLSAHPGFRPILLAHEDYLRFYCGWRLITASSSLLCETHPNNGIPHHHSLTRVIAQKL